MAADCSEAARGGPAASTDSVQSVLCYWNVSPPLLFFQARIKNTECFLKMLKAQFMVEGPPPPPSCFRLDCRLLKAGLFVFIYYSIYSL